MTSHTRLHSASAIARAHDYVHEGGVGSTGHGIVQRTPRIFTVSSHQSSNRPGMSEVVHQDVKEYYGKRVQKTGDLLTNVCTVGSATFSTEAKEAMKMIHPDVLAK